MKFKLAENEVEVSGGGLNGTYSSIQFHFHWGDTEHHPGSEHEIDGQRYPMEVEGCTSTDIYWDQHACAPALLYLLWSYYIFLDAHSQLEERSYCG